MMDEEADPQHKRAFRLFRARETVQKMLNNRKYLVSNDETSFDEFKNTFGYPVDKKKLMMMTAKRDDPNERIFVFFPDEEKVDVKSMATYADQMQTQEVRRAILVVEKDISPFARKALAEAAPLFYIEVFKESELLVDITEHELVPKHEVLSQDEKRQLLVRYNLKDSQLPRMYTTDPITRYFGLKRGQVVKIIRSSETAGRYVTYRIVH
ncbi:DNA-directed RNA polymerases I, II, and III subunit RPABC1 [Hondaea fermentalgiana]|uniref:DNA-directed RNA polymerases I, II, and III subunit RPABC1 n=1 Tax=Hondaea fermentalgiana TaxID=2315210 RepID=A0A2R5GSM7_9STRA|nr:DNA-directed RNA polymerases I, II, and III subunit RPABC1 [Hondaea fermentalgiana]|eukprot:GBG33595.1 DNA-directed RNA polymerases I, II, and III subunit RPABC1 [Hondaea fermentalgiana]